MKLRIIALVAVLMLAGHMTQAKDYIFPEPSTTPSKSQMKQIERRYGMFIHFGINTFHDQEWTDGSKPASSYAPTAIDAEQWIRSAKEAGMKYVILITKHHDGFCLWDSRYTDYDVASSSNDTNVVVAVAKACRKYGIGLGFYYSLWDRKVNPDVDNLESDAAYNKYMINQIEELLNMVKKITPVVEFWFDGGWVKKSYRWPVLDLYNTIKRLQPDCQVGINWPIGSPENIDNSVKPEQQREGYPIRYFPSDFRLGDPYLPADNDPKIFTYSGQQYYMPWESTVCISQRWFYNTTDTTYKTLDELEELYKRCTKNDNILILNCPPNREGRLRDKDVELLKQLRERLNL